MEDFLSNKKDCTLQLPRQPFILVARGGDGQIIRICVIVEYSAISVLSVRKAVDILYKSFHVFNLEYPAALQPLYGFVDLLYDDSSAVSHSVREKFNLLCRKTGIFDIQLAQSHRCALSGHHHYEGHRPRLVFSHLTRGSQGCCRTSPPL